MSADQAAVIARHLSPIGDAQARAPAAELLLAHAPTLHLSQLARAAQEIRVRLVAEEEPVAGEAAPPAFQSWVKVSSTGSTDQPFWVLTGELDALGGERLRIALEAAAGAPRPEDSRSHSERLGDALVTVAGLALDSGRLPVTGSRRPHLTLIADLETLRSLPLPEHHAPDTLPGTDDEVSGLLAPPAGASTSRGLRLDGDTARQLACDCTLRVLLTRARGNRCPSDGPRGPSHRTSGTWSWPATVTVSGPAANGRPPGARGITRSTGRTEVRPRSTTSPCSAASITVNCTSHTGS